jgi:pheromone shutdown-related protein TraB
MSNVTRLQINNKELILIATAHISADSAREVSEIIAQEKPDSVCIELDQERYQQLTQPKQWQDSDIITIIKQKKVELLVITLILGAFQKKLAKQLDTQSGGEMLAAITAAHEVNAQIVLADRNIQITFKRILSKLSLWQKIMMFSQLLASMFENPEISDEEIEKMKTQDMLEQALSEIEKSYPIIKTILVDERDQYLAYHIINAPGNKVVAVLGAAHTIGITKIINQPLTIENLDTIDQPSITSKLVGWIIPVLIVGLIIKGFTISPDIGLQQLINWILWNGSLAAIACLLLLAHPLTILIAFVLAPLTTLNPILAVGWFAGLSEAYFHKPTVADFTNLSTDVMSVKGFLSNRVTRILMIVILSNLGATLGSFISGLSIIKQLF